VYFYSVLLVLSGLKNFGTDVLTLNTLMACQKHSLELHKRWESKIPTGVGGWRFAPPMLLSDHGCRSQLKPCTAAVIVNGPVRYMSPSPPVTPSLYYPPSLVATSYIPPCLSNHQHGEYTRSKFSCRFPLDLEMTGLRQMSKFNHGDGLWSVFSPPSCGPLEHTQPPGNLPRSTALSASD
jgi:hypothetical protein